ncbi:hypothetical protein RJT34_06921 [Clitoria ternatea]|uniref:Uncharacterized protein n=1 Tax=Clitoria ternatea TaxID=43366 RepID=A0AAN9K264_CLITE
MKRSLSSTTCGKLMTLLLLLFLFSFSATNCKAISSGNTLNHNHHHYCDSFSKRNTRSLCTGLQRIQQRLGKSLQAIPPSSKKSGIDPRFGAEKRLVPSGPNPLHN